MTLYPASIIIWLFQIVIMDTEKKTQEGQHQGSVISFWKVSLKDYKIKRKSKG